MKKENLEYNVKYLTYLILITIVIGIIPNLILRPLWLIDSSSGISLFTILLNSFLIPISLLISHKFINEKLDKHWWIINFILIIGAVYISIHLGFLNWAYSADQTPGGWGANNVDKGTKMIINLELTIGLGIIAIAFIFKSLEKISNRIKKPTANNGYK